MFTGIVTEIGSIVSVTRSAQDARLEIGCRMAAGLRKGESVSVSGICLTVESSTRHAFQAAASSETLGRTTLGRIQKDQRVNLERALTLEDSLGGHLVQGHVDGTGRIQAVVNQGAGRTVEIAVPACLLSHLAPRGSITVDGVSLTVTSVAQDGFRVMLIPATLEATTLGERVAGDAVNLEADIISRYLARLLEVRTGSAGSVDLGAWLDEDGRA